MTKHALGGWIYGKDSTGGRDHLLLPPGTKVFNHDQALELLISTPDLRRLFAAAVGPARVQSIMLDVAAPAVWENEGGTCLADTD